jgi:hypothetical protein
MDSFRIKPARDGLVVRDPVTREAIPAEGAEVPASTYWRRRLRDGDVIMMDPKPPRRARPAPVSLSEEGS